MANGANPWLSSAFGNVSNSNQDYVSYLAGLGINVDPDQVGQFFGGIAEDYQQDIGMARAGLSQGMANLRSQGQAQAMQLGGGQGLSSIGGSGFGRQGYGAQQGLGAINQQYGQGLQSGLLGYTSDLQSAQRGMYSSFRDVAAGLLARDSAGIYQGDQDLRGDPNAGYTAGSDTSDQQYGDDLSSEQDGDSFNPNVYTTQTVTVDGVTWTWNPSLGQYQQPLGFSDKELKDNITLIGSSDSGVNIYTFEYKDKSYGDGLYQGVIAQEVPWASTEMSNGYLAVDYNKVDVDFKRIY